MGPGWYKKWPKFLKNLTEGDSTGAVEELTTSAWYGQVKSRAKTIVSMIKSGMEGAGSKLAAMSSKTSAAPTMTASAAPPATVKSKPTAVASSGASGGGGSTGTAPTPANVATNKLEKSLAKDSSLAVQAPSQGAQPVAPSPSSGTQLGAASATVADLKNAPKKDVAIVDNSKISRSRVSQLTEGGSIPSPIADRGSIDLFNFFEPPGGMKA